MKSVADAASVQNAFVVYLEHRFYGASIPGISNRTENLRWITVDQALADIDRFVTFIRTNFTGSVAPVILVGTRYAGSMAVWYHQRHTGRAAGIWAFSAPLYAKIDMPEYLEIVGQQIRRIGGDGCYDRIQHGLLYAEKLFENGSFSRLQEEFRLCNATCPGCSISALNMYVSYTLSRLVQDNK